MNGLIFFLVHTLQTCKKASSIYIYSKAVAYFPSSEGKPVPSWPVVLMLSTRFHGAQWNPSSLHYFPRHHRFHGAIEISIYYYYYYSSVHHLGLGERERRREGERTKWLQRGRRPPWSHLDRKLTSLPPSCQTGTSSPPNDEPLRKVDQRKITFGPEIHHARSKTLLGGEDFCARHKETRETAWREGGGGGGGGGKGGSSNDYWNNCYVLAHLVLAVSFLGFS